MKKRQSVKTKMIEFRNPYHVEPPGALREILSHPINQSEAVDLAIFQEPDKKLLQEKLHQILDRKDAISE